MLQINSRRKFIRYWAVKKPVELADSCTLCVRCHGQAFRVFRLTTRYRYRRTNDEPQRRAQDTPSDVPTVHVRIYTNQTLDSTIAN